MSPILRMMAQRVALGLFTLFLVSVIIFSSMSLLPGGFAEAVLGQNATPETVAAFNSKLGLDRPGYVRYVEWVADALHGDFGDSYAGLDGNMQRRVADVVEPRLYNTFFLAVMTAVIAVPLSLFLGVLAALYRNSWLDRLTNATTLTTVAMPEFFIAYVLMVVLAIKHRWFFALATIDGSTGFWEHVYRAALPAATLILVTVAYMMRMTRAALVNLLESPYIEMARLKGIARTKVILRHALPNAWAPIATVIAFSLAYLIVGVVVVEVVFVYPGIGQVMVDAVSTRDVPVVQACTLIFATTYIVLNLVADVIGIVTNPRLLHPR
ncbi:ABC transporter permease [Mesorhizobium sp. B3-1-3]|uniref:ABC transporter permease n=1 Tax=unclassified Mesorhizobium TaxID=325217 RepID=UPI001125FBE2|nr:MULTISPECIES: ABC transporter permease [unclassified Mesorhizobium]TPI56043.1 ABC transporter permease [Mesorhizobium sp. B3-1-8]TPI63337.1 ABC transporter permease [Mesorhizobium sp. B3-1-3]